jgi:hypothetical protein
MLTLRPFEDSICTDVERAAAERGRRGTPDLGGGARDILHTNATFYV